jgi:hypothetical protein
VDKYGADKVAQIITFGTLRSAAIRDVGGRWTFPRAEVDKWRAWFRLFRIKRDALDDGPTAADVRGVDYGPCSTRRAGLKAYLGTPARMLRWWSRQAAS